MKRQCPSLAENVPALNQAELFAAALVNPETAKTRQARAAQANPDVVSREADPAPPPKPPRLAHHGDDHGIQLYHGDCLDLLDDLAAKYPDGIFDMVFADPPYFLSNGGSTCQGGERVAVDKGQWDKSGGLRPDFRFTVAWLRRCRRVLNPGGTLWVSGTHHGIFLVGYVLQKLGFRILNDIVWEKPNPPPNLSCRYFTHSTETLIWAARSTDTNQVFNYDLMRKVNRGTQMQTVWRLNVPSPDEKGLGGHPTQKPVALVTRTLLAATCEGSFVFDPFLGSGTTAVACLRNRRRFVGIDSRSAYVTLAMNRTEAEVEKGADLFTHGPERQSLISDCRPADNIFQRP